MAELEDDVPKVVKFYTKQAERFDNSEGEQLKEKLAGVNKGAQDFLEDLSRVLKTLKYNVGDAGVLLVKARRASAPAPEGAPLPSGTERGAPTTPSTGGAAPAAPEKDASEKPT